MSRNPSAFRSDEVFANDHPLANSLRLLMGSPRHLANRIETALRAASESRSEEDTRIYKSAASEYRKRFKDVLALFRNGGFSSVDAFCKLAANRQADQVRVLKRWMRLCLAVHDPEDVFAESDYYPFAERLFVEDTRYLRRDVAVLSFNYDPYLEFLLWRSYRVRCNAAGGPVDSEGDGTVILSGMLGRNVGELVQREGFCLLKLHGSIAWPEVRDEERNVGFGHLFGKHMAERLSALCGPLGDSDSPVLFP